MLNCVINASSWSLLFAPSVTASVVGNPSANVEIFCCCQLSQNSLLTNARIRSFDVKLKVKCLEEATRAGRFAAD